MAVYADAVELVPTDAKMLFKRDRPEADVEGSGNGGSEPTSAAIIESVDIRDVEIGRSSGGGEVSLVNSLEMSSEDPATIGGRDKWLSVVCPLGARTAGIARDISEHMIHATQRARTTRDYWRSGLRARVWIGRRSIRAVPILIWVSFVPQHIAV